MKVVCVHDDEYQVIFYGMKVESSPLRNRVHCLFDTLLDLFERSVVIEASFGGSGFRWEVECGV